MLEGDVGEGGSSSEEKTKMLGREAKQAEEEVERVTFDDVLAELGEFGTEQKVNILSLLNLTTNIRHLDKKDPQVNYLMFSLPYLVTSMQLLGSDFSSPLLFKRSFTSIVTSFLSHKEFGCFFVHFYSFCLVEFDFHSSD